MLIFKESLLTVKSRIKNDEYSPPRIICHRSFSVWFPSCEILFN